MTGKSEKSDVEKDVRIAMIQNEVTQTDLANYEDVSPQAINNRIARLTTDRAQAFRKLIKDVAAWKQERTPKKATG